MSWPSVWESPHSSDVTTKITSAMTKIRLVPNRADMRPMAKLPTTTPTVYMMIMLEV